MWKPERHRVVITGMGMCTSLGRDLPTCWQRLVAGDNGIRRVSFWDASEYPSKVAAEAGRLLPEETGLSSVPRAWCRRAVRLFLPVVQEAFRDACLDRVPIPPAQIGLAVGASVNYLDMALLKDYFRLRRSDRPAFVVDTACAASSHAIGEAYRQVRRGRVRAMVAGGAASLVSPLVVLGFGLLGALTRNPDPEEAARPFDRRRDGFVMGEGGGAVVLESLESAQARGARIYAELAGYGSTLNASHTLTDPSPGGAMEAAAMMQAMKEASLVPEQVEYIAAHGTSTPKNDAVETAAIKRVFGAHACRLMVSSNKAQIGHTISAAGVVNLICAVKAIHDGVVPPTMHLRHPDPECDLDYVPNQSRQARARAALANAFAFGGQNAVLAVRAWASA